MERAPNWRAQRRDAYAAHAAALERRKAAETAQARKLIAAFVREMGVRNIAPRRLRARVPDTTTTYRTNIIGWYLRRNGSLGVGTDGAFYILDTSASLKARLLGVHPEAAEPPLTVGVGARDGESMSLERLLRLRLEAADQSA